MKIRYGFVSNSSSSSFLVKGISPISLAKQMLKVVQADWMEYSSNKSKRAEFFKRCFNRLNALGDKLPVGADGITLPSTNYETYIVWDDTASPSHCFVDTCNNHSWDVIIDMSFPLNEFIGYGLMHKLITRCTYFDVRSGQVVRYPIYREDRTNLVVCPKCKQENFEDVFTVSGQRVCSECFNVIPVI